MARARLAEVDLPDFGMPEERPELPASLYPARVTRLCERADARGYDRLVVYADREHSANLAYLTGFDPRFEEAILVVGPTGDPAILVGQRVLGDGRRRAAADAAPPVPGPQPAEPAPRPVAAAGRDPRPTRASGPAAGSGVVGWKTYARPRDDRGPGLPRRRAAPADRARAGSSRTPTRPVHRRRPTVCASSTRSSSWPPSSGPPARLRTASAACSAGSDRG